MLEVDALDVYYGETQVLRGVSLKVDDGGLVALFGPNGHGKSTLLKAVCGLVPSSGGRVLLQGREIQKLPAEKLVAMGVVLISEERHLFPEMTIMENLRLGAYNKSARKKEKENLDFVLALFPKLAQLAKKPASTLSGGEARMLAIGRGLMSNGSMLCIDEPSFGLSPAMRSQVFEKIAELPERGISVLVVEQSTGDIAEMADYMYLMEDGRIVFEGDKSAAFADEEFRKVFLGVR
jgi:branched-chain amino acid transport system ATP-binding protein